MSQLTQLKAAISNVAQNLETTAGQLYTYGHQLDSQITVISSAIGGTAPNEDKEMVAALQQGRESVMEAVAQLRAASAKAKDWCNKI